jgi:hypothetical protein
MANGQPIVLLDIINDETLREAGGSESIVVAPRASTPASPM